MELVYGFETQRVPADRPGPAHCWLRLVAPDAPDDEGRAPLNLSLVLDRSGSMRGEKIQSVKDAARALISMLSAKDLLSVVSYAEDVTTLVPPSPVRDRDSIARMLDGLMARGGTNLSGGWLQGVAYVEKKRLKKGINRVLLMTDGLATRGILDTAQLVKMVGKKKRKKIATSTFGFGEGFNEDLLINMSKAAGGAFYYIEDPDDAPHAFTQELGNLLSVVAQNFSVKLKAQGGAKFVRLLNGYPHTLSDAKVEAQAGDVYAGDARGFMLEMQLPAGLPAEGAVVAKGYVEFDDVAATKRRTIDIQVKATGG
ncbi:MAG: vWA domain-containing protein, partial [Planctomycetota bacterium]